MGDTNYGLDFPECFGVRILNGFLNVSLFEPCEDESYRRRHSILCDRIEQADPEIGNTYV